jgi:hypothetical protein
VAFDTSQNSYQALRAIVAERTQPLLACVGAGLSAPTGLPGWGALRGRLVHALRNKAASLGSNQAAKLSAAATLAESEESLWVAFEILRRGLGETSFRDEVKDALKLAATVGIPDGYTLLTKLRIRGVLNLNLDRLASRAFGILNASELIVEHSGANIARLHQVLTEPPRFIGNLHGTLEDTGSWVFTKPQLDKLLRNRAYESFIRTALSTHTVVFLGITTDDLAIGGHLEALSRLQIQMPTHFWVTDRADAKTDFWAEQVGLRVIGYRAVDGDHSPVTECLKDLVTATPTDEPSAPPVALGREAARPNELPSSTDMLTWDAEKIREVMNTHATELLKDESNAGRELYAAFCKKYDQIIYRAWYVGTAPEDNQLLGYTLKREIAKGSFGRVYLATDPKGDQVAIKVLLENIRNETRMLHSFRRGVRSMRILSSHGVEGMVAYSEASEIPAFVVMEWIDGPNLAEAKASGFIGDWDMILRVALELAAVIRKAHALPERVLHRDIRPSNVMLKDYHSGSGDTAVVVLDFDLSWHRNAFEVSVLHSTSAGYLAPEQIRRTSSASTRNAAVDSFGLGMTCLFLCTGVDPLPDEHRHENWIATVTAACDAIPVPPWKSAAARFARLIVKATQDKQSARWDVAELEGELQRLHSAVDDPAKVVAADLLAEELAAHTDCMNGYRWNMDAMRAEKQMPTGLRYSIGADLQNERIRLSIEWAATGVEDRGHGLEKYVVSGAKKAAESLRAAGWRGISDTSGNAVVHISATIDVEALRDGVAKVATRIDRAVEALRFGS